MPPRKRTRKKTAKPKKRTRKQVPGGARRKRGGFPCPDCDFVAKHAMGLGRHRSTRHGVVSQRQRRMRSSGAWLTREQAADRAGVHYNTIRGWEQGGLLRTTKRAGVRGTLVNATDLGRVLAERGSSAAMEGSGADAAALAALEQRFTQLIEGLEQLIASVKVKPARGRRRRR